MDRARPMRRRGTRCPGWAVAWLFALAPAVLQAQMLAAIPVDVATAVTAPASASATVLSVRVHVADAPGLARFLGLPDMIDGTARFLDLALEPGAPAAVGMPSGPTAASFIVDFDDPAVMQLRQRMLDAHGPTTVDGAQIVRFVSRSMNSEFAANADLASEVARTLKGDCTEHALLTAALARSMQIPAYIVQGAAIVQAEGRWQAYGHAWVQTFEAGRWTVRDSALADWPGPVYYLPALVLADEGPGFKLGMLLGLSRLPSRLEIRGSAPPAAAR